MFALRCRDQLLEKSDFDFRPCCWLGSPSTWCLTKGQRYAGALGAAVAAFYQVFFKEFDAKFMEQPIAMTVAIALCILTTFSDPFKKLALNNIFFQKVSSLGLLPGFLIAAIIAYLVGEAMLNCVLLDHYLMHKAQCS